MDLLFFLTLFAFIISYLVHAELYLRRLKKHCPDVFAKLGSPSVIGKKQSALPVMGFFGSGGYRQLPDVALVRMGTRLVIHFFAVFIFFIGFFVFILLYMPTP